MDYKLEAMCLVATDIDAMRGFYAGVFDVEFTGEEIGESDTERAIGIYDPDGNFMVFKQRKRG